jgi:hypothetical protein
LDPIDDRQKTMNRILSISLLSLWLLFNYSRIWNYRFCPVMPLIATPTVKCDCERQSPEASTDNGQPETERAAAKQKPEEVFTGTASLALSGQLIASLTAKSLFISRKVFAGFPTTLLQPPRCQPFSNFI